MAIFKLILQFDNHPENSVLTYFCQLKHCTECPTIILTRYTTPKSFVFVYNLTLLAKS